MGCRLVAECNLFKLKSQILYQPRELRVVKENEELTDKWMI